MPFVVLRRSAVFRMLLALSVASFFAACGPRPSNVQRGNQEQILHRGVYPDIADLDPHLATSGADFSVLSALFEGLVTEDPVDLHPVPAVAKGWDVMPDGRVYTFHLRENAKWSNGDPVTAPDFVASFQRVLTPSLAAEYASFLFVIENAEAYYKGALKDFEKVGVSAPDARTLRITLEHPDAQFLSMLTHTAFMPVHLPTLRKYGPTDKRGNAWARPGQFVGNGPFVLKEWRQGQRLATEKAGTYWDAANVKLNGVTFHFFENRDSEERAFRAGQLHITEALPPGKIDVYQRDRPDVLRIDPYLGTEFYRINVAQPFLNDRRIRRALTLAVNRESIARNILRGGQIPAATFTPPGTSGFTPRTTVAYDPERARALFAEAGYPGGKGTPTVDLLLNPSESHRAVAEAIQEMWRKELGFEVKLVSQEFKTMSAARRTGQYQLMRSVWIPDYLGPLSFLSVFTSSSGNNYTGWANPTYDQWLFEAARVTNESAREALLQKAEALLLDDCPLIPIYHYTHIFLKQPAVKNWHPTLLDHHPYKYVYLENP